MNPPDPAAVAGTDDPTSTPARSVLAPSTLAPVTLAPSTLAQSTLARRQAELVASLVAGGPPPAGFDETRLAATRSALLRKRAAAAARAWPLLAHVVGADWNQIFARHRGGHPPVGGLRDGWHVARALRDQGALPVGAARELAEREAELRYDGRRPPRPRRFARLRRAIAGRRAG
jgi:hypothetical protein